LETQHFENCIELIKNKQTAKVTKNKHKMLVE